MNEMFDWMWNIIALTIQIQRHIAQSFLNRKIVNVNERAKFKSSMSSFIKGKKKSWRASTNSELMFWRMTLNIQAGKSN